MPYFRVVGYFYLAEYWVCFPYDVDIVEIYIVLFCFKINDKYFMFYLKMLLFVFELLITI